MKYLLIPLAFVAGYAMACPADGVKDATAPADAKMVAAAKPTPSPTPATKATTTKAVTKVATKSVAEPRKSAPL